MWIFGSNVLIPLNRQQERKGRKKSNFQVWGREAPALCSVVGKVSPLPRHSLSTLATSSPLPCPRLATAPPLPRHRLATASPLPRHSHIDSGKSSASNSLIRSSPSFCPLMNFNLETRYYSISKFCFLQTETMQSSRTQSIMKNKSQCSKLGKLSSRGYRGPTLEVF